MTAVENLDDVVQIARKASEWASPKGLRTDSVPWRLYEKAKQNFWDPADIDFSQDAKDWANLSEEQQFVVAGLARGFMVGEEGVTLDIVPLLIALADEGRVEEVIYLTTFAMEEAKHVDFFHRWFDAVGFDLQHMMKVNRERMIERGVTPPDPDRTEGLFERELPRVMRNVLVDRSPKAILDASITYNQFIEGCLAMAGYKVWGRLFEMFGVLPGIQQGLALVRKDESRHITYGTYLCRRIIAADPSLAAFGRERMVQLRDGFNPVGGGGGYGAGGPGEGNGAQQVQNEGAGMFLSYVMEQSDKRIAILEKAATITPEEAEGSGAEEAEADLLEV